MLNDSDRMVLNDLITTTIDSANGYERSAENDQGGRYAGMFREMAAERRTVASTLQQAVRGAGYDPHDSGSIAAAVHRGWEDLITALRGGSEKAVINEVERGEDYLKQEYERGLKNDNLSPEGRRLIEEAYQSVRKGHDRVSAIKHQMEDSAA